MWLYIYILTAPFPPPPKKRKTSPRLEYVVIFVLHYMTYYFKKNTKLNLSLLVTYLSTISHNTSFLNFFFFGIGRYFMYIYISEPFCPIHSTTTDRVNRARAHVCTRSEWDGGPFCFEQDIWGACTIKIVTRQLFHRN